MFKTLFLLSPVLESLHWLPIEKRIQYKILCLTFKCLHNLGPKYLSDLLVHYEPIWPPRSSDKLLLKVPKTRLVSYGDRSFMKAAPTLWNNLSVSLRSVDTLSTFQDKLKTHLYTSWGYFLMKAPVNMYMELALYKCIVCYVMLKAFSTFTVHFVHFFNSFEAETNYKAGLLLQ